MVEVLILLGSFLVLCMIGMPVAYTLGLAAILGALWIDDGKVNGTRREKGHGTAQNKCSSENILWRDVV